MGNDGTIPAKDKGHYPRPLGGHEPSAQGDSGISQSFSAQVGDSNHSTQPEGGIYDYSSSMGGSSSADLMRGYSQGEKINATSDPGPEDKAAGKPRA